MSEEQQPVFRIEKIYVKGLSLEIPNAPAVFLEREPPGGCAATYGWRAYR